MRGSSDLISPRASHSDTESRPPRTLDGRSETEDDDTADVAEAAYDAGQLLGVGLEPDCRHSQEHAQETVLRRDATEPRAGRIRTKRSVSPLGARGAARLAGQHATALPSASFSLSTVVRVCLRMAGRTGASRPLPLRQHRNPDSTQPSRDVASATDAVRDSGVCSAHHPDIIHFDPRRTRRRARVGTHP